MQDRFLMTEDNLYFDRSKYVVLPEFRNDRVDGSQQPFIDVIEFFFIATIY